MRDGANLIVSVIVLLVALVVWAIGWTACAPSDAEVVAILGDEGLHDIRLTGYEPFRCSDDDTWNTGFTARRTVLGEDGHPEERVVEGTLCCGWVKDCTVRHH